MPGLELIPVGLMAARALVAGRIVPAAVVLRLLGATLLSINMLGPRERGAERRISAGIGVPNKFSMAVGERDYATVRVERNAGNDITTTVRAGIKQLRLEAGDCLLFAELALRVLAAGLASSGRGIPREAAATAGVQFVPSTVTFH